MIFLTQTEKEGALILTGNSINLLFKGIWAMDFEVRCFAYEAQLAPVNGMVSQDWSMTMFFWMWVDRE